MESNGDLELVISDGLCLSFLYIFESHMEEPKKKVKRSRWGEKKEESAEDKAPENGEEPVVESDPEAKRKVLIEDCSCSHFS